MAKDKAKEDKAKGTPEAANPRPAAEVGHGVTTSGPANPLPVAENDTDRARYDPNEATGTPRPASQPAAFDPTVPAESLSDAAGRAFDNLPGITGHTQAELDDLPEPGVAAGRPGGIVPRSEPARPKYTQATDAAVPLVQLGFWDAGPIMVWDVVNKFRELFQDIDGGRYWEALDDLGDLLKMVPPIFVSGQHATLAATTAAARDSAIDEFEGFGWIERRFAVVKARAFGAGGDMASGAAPAAAAHAYVAISPGDLAQIIAVAELVFAWLKRLRDRRGV